MTFDDALTLFVLLLVGLVLIVGWWLTIQTARGTKR